MGAKVNQPTFAKMLAENIEWTERQPYTLERDHVVQVMQWLIDEKYMPERIAELEAERDEARRKLVDSESLFELAEAGCDELYEAWEPPEDGQEYWERHHADTNQAGRADPPKQQEHHEDPHDIMARREEREYFGSDDGGEVDNDS